MKARSFKQRNAVSSVSRALFYSEDRKSRRNIEPQWGTNNEEEDKRSKTHQPSQKAATLMSVVTALKEKSSPKPLSGTPT
jgi:hypothetical protein